MVDSPHVLPKLTIVQSDNLKVLHLLPESPPTSDGLMQRTEMDDVGHVPAGLSPHKSYTS